VTPPAYTLTQGSIALLISFPHSGPLLPEPYASSMTPAARLVADTDWHLPTLYDFATALGASTLHANYSRYIIDMNRPATGESLYPGQTTTSLCPTETFRGEPLYPDAGGPSDAEIADRVEKFWQPYHGALQAELDRLKAAHGQVLLWEAHSIASILPRLFEGQLPDLNIGTFGGASCAPAVHNAVVTVAEASPFTSVVNGRFKGGHITRHFGQPSQGVHAVQMEMTQVLYMDENAPFAYLPDVANKVKPTLQAMIEAAYAALPR
jgi:N-formylglutamate deformylase